MKAVLAILVVCSALICTQAVPRNPLERFQCLRQARIYETRIREILENLREDLKNGIPEKNIPPVDPLTLDNYNLIIKEEPVAKLNWTMNGKIAGLMSWNLTKISFSVAGFKFSFALHFPEIQGKGVYDIDGTILSVLPVYGGGEFDVLAKDLIINGSGNIGSRGSGENQTLFLKNFQVGSSLDEFTFAVTGLMEDDNLSFLISQMISESLPDMIDSFQDQINQAVSARITSLVDKVLVNMTIKDLLEMLKPKPDEKWWGEHCGDF